MTDIYLRSTTGNDSNTGLGGFANAKATYTGALAAMVAGDRLIVSSLHTESSSAIKTYSNPGTLVSPNQIICVNDSDGVTPAVGAEVATAGPYQMIMQGSFMMYGVTFRHGSGSSSNPMSFATSISTDVIQRYEKCFINMNATSGSAFISIGSSGSSNNSRSRILWRDTDLRLAAPNYRVEIFQDFSWRGGSLIAGAAVSYIFRVGIQGRTSRVQVDGVDLSQMASTTDLVTGTLSTGFITFRNCKLPEAWTGQLVQGIADPSLRVEMFNCSSNDLIYNLWVETFSGSLKTDTAVFKNGGAVDGTVPVSWKFALNANPVWYLSGLDSIELFRWNDVVGKPITVYVDSLVDGLPLNNSEIWLDIQYSDTTGNPISSTFSGRVDVNASTSEYAASGATWNGISGMTSPQRQRVSVTFTPQKVGMLIAKVVCARRNSTISVDPELQVS